MSSLAPVISEYLYHPGRFEAGVLASHARQQSIYRRIMHAGNLGLLLSVGALLALIGVCYLYPQYFSLPTQVAAHIALVLSATAIKVFYVLRCIGRQGLGLAIT